MSDNRVRDLCDLATLPILAAATFYGKPAMAMGTDPAEPGMPQLNPVWLPSQIFWLVVCFSILYLLMAKLALPRIAGIQRARAGKIQHDLDEARKARDQFAQIIASYNKMQSEARLKAQAMLAESDKDIAALTSKGTTELAGVLLDRMQQAERRIGIDRAQVMSAMPQIVGEISAAIVERVAGIHVENANVEAVARRAVTSARKG